MKLGMTLEQFVYKLINSSLHFFGNDRKAVSPGYSDRPTHPSPSQAGRV